MKGGGEEVKKRLEVGNAKQNEQLAKGDWEERMENHMSNA